MNSPDDKPPDTSGRAAAFLSLVGERVRKARERRGISRNKLAELSRVSLRYLAQLESGSGNISIALLWRISEALDHRMEWLVGSDDPWTSEVVRCAELFREAKREQRRQVMRILDPSQPAQLRQKRLCLIGLRGAGKTTLGKRLGQALALPFVELNREIEEVSGIPVNEVLALYGQEGYRHLERRALERVVATADEVVLAVAGGIVAEPETFAFLLRHFHTIWLKARADEHMERVRAQGDLRPMSGNPQAMDELKSILASREELYAQAELMVDTSGRTPDETTRDLVDSIAKLGIV
ncbi:MULTISPECIES: helix-turn-helix transcriptional regulator [Bradyrhizobium]|uniref:Shikimate kinase n=1 Tax=Bradyrhizobium denitrificans TaxID=2734912 RepID=A0ABS5GDU0_9BRAD|nr:MULTISPECIES: helix-turn-helix transcriptional regulator [Bradyrhizobium]RTM06640.1 MAG: helix-turn-helix domain-containing protein [Bradyrhizobiaceae bacterium]MBR1139345.1 helix-turn-helix transcriptional regulator [Bradyrhizobium denitrificans]MCL8486509.1 helix-turn-helix transcriptional regulator [Bradyrhizobium denitrificans]MDU1495282.1 helix-turn-helix transcriptional regulator [Bradyrhizobium sp.]MDU1545369.1 helix-turn-helix transcriptional regulator [Bradyrhizobium sp.]